MLPWVQIVLIVCAAALTAALVAAILAARATLRHAASVLEIVEQELRPLVGQIHGLTDDVRDLTRETRREVERIGEVTEHVQTAADGVGRIVVGAGRTHPRGPGHRSGGRAFAAASTCSWTGCGGNQGGNHGR